MGERKVAHYNICSHYDIAKLVDLVNHHIKAGYQLFGPPFSDGVIEEDKHEAHIHQAMVKYD